MGDPIPIPKDPVARARLARMAGLTEEEERVLNEWCAEMQREQDAATRRGLERIAAEDDLRNALEADR